MNNRLIAGGCDVTSEKKQWYFIGYCNVLYTSKRLVDK